MRGATWLVQDDGAQPLVAAPPASTVSLAFVLATVRRLWYLWLAFLLVGMTLAAAWLALVPDRSVGTVTLLLAHDPGTESQTAMATDISLLETRTVAQELSHRLALDVSPEDLQQTILAQPTTSSVLQIDISGSDPDDAARRARILADVYLEFREDQLLLQNQAFIDGHRQRIESLRAQVDQLSQQVDLATASGADGEKIADVLASRSQLLGQISTLENAIEDASLEVTAVVAASRVLDPASVVPQSSLKRAVLVMGSGIVGGLGIGLGLVLIYSVTTGRLRSRADVAAAIGHPVAFSSGDLSRRWRRPGPRQIAGLDLLVDGFLTALPKGGKRPHRLALLSVDCPREAATVVAAAAHRLTEHGSVAVVDHTGTGFLAAQVGSTMSGDEQGERAVVVAEPGTDAVGDAVLSLFPFDIGRGLAHLKASARRVVVLVKVGRSTPESLRTVAQAARAAGVELEFVMLVGADSSDDSFGGAAALVDVPEKAPRAT